MSRLRKLCILQLLPGLKLISLSPLPFLTCLPVPTPSPVLCLVPPRSFLAWLTPPRPNLTFHSATLCHLRETSWTDSKQQTTYSPSDPSLLCSDVIWSLLNAQCLGNHLIPCGCLTKVCGVDGCCFPGSCLVSVRYRLRSGVFPSRS